MCPGACCGCDRCPRGCGCLQRSSTSPVRRTSAAFRNSGRSRWWRFARSDMHTLHVPRRLGLPAEVVYALKYAVVSVLRLPHTPQIFVGLTMTPNAAHQRRADALNVERIYPQCAFAACACYAATPSRSWNRLMPSVAGHLIVMCAIGLSLAVDGQRCSLWEIDCSIWATRSPRYATSASESRAHRGI